MRRKNLVVVRKVEKIKLLNNDLTINKIYRTAKLEVTAIRRIN